MTGEPAPSGMRAFVDPSFADRHRARYAAVIRRESTLAEALAANDDDWHASRTFKGWRPNKVFVRKGNRGRRYVGGGWL